MSLSAFPVPALGLHDADRHLGGADVATSRRGRDMTRSGGRVLGQQIERTGQVADGAQRDAGIVVGRLDPRMPEQHLDHPYVGLVPQQMTGEGMAQRMGRGALGDPGLLGRAPDGPADHVGIGARLGRRRVQELGENLDAVDIGPVGLGREVAERHVVDQALAQRPNDGVAHRGLLSRVRWIRSAFTRHERSPRQGHRRTDAPRPLFSAIATFLCLLASAAPVAAGQMEDELDAESRGDWATAIKLLRPLAEGGNAVAQGHLGVFYEIGRGVPVDYAEAAKWVRKSAEQGDAESQSNLANLYRLGRGVPFSEVEGLKWLQKSAAQGFYGAFLNLGHVYLHGNGVPIDFVQAYMWYRLASNSARTPQSLYVRQKADSYLADLTSKMTPEQVAEAERRAQDWKP